MNPIQTNQAPSNLWAPSYWENIARTRWGRYVAGVEENVLLRAHEAAGEPGTVLDYGCGEGRWSKFLHPRGWSPICVDMDPEALETCQRCNESFDCHLVAADNKVLPARDRSVKLILCFEVKSVLESEWFLPEADRVLIDNGMIAGVFFNRTSPRGCYRHWTDRFGGKEGFYSLSLRAFKGRLAERSMDLIHAEGMCWFPFTRTSNSALVPVFTSLESSLGLRSVTNLSPWVVFIAQRATRVRALSKAGPENDVAVAVRGHRSRLRSK